MVGIIIWLAVLLVIAIIGLSVLVSGRKNEDGLRAMIGGSTVGLAVVVGLVSTGFGLFYTQGEGVSVVQVSFTGTVVKTTANAGMHVKAPWDKVHEFNIRNQTLEMYSNDGGNGKDGAAISAPLDGGANAQVSITITYSIDRNSVESIYKGFGSQESLSDTVLKPTLRDIVRMSSAEYAPLAIKQERARLGADIQLALEEIWGPYGVTLNQVNLGDISLDESTEKAISDVIAAQQRVEQSRAELEQAQITAEKTKTDAQAAADADQIIRCGATVTFETKLVNGKETQVQVVTPKVNEQCEDRLNEQVLTTKYYDTLEDLGRNGNMVVVIPETGAAPIINLPVPAED